MEGRERTRRKGKERVPRGARAREIERKRKIAEKQSRQRVLDARKGRQPQVKIADLSGRPSGGEILSRAPSTRTREENVALGDEDDEDDDDRDEVMAEPDLPDPGVASGSGSMSNTQGASLHTDRIVSLKGALGHVLQARTGIRKGSTRKLRGVTRDSRRTLEAILSSNALELGDASLERKPRQGLVEWALDQAQALHKLHAPAVPTSEVLVDVSKPLPNTPRSEVSAPVAKSVSQEEHFKALLASPMPGLPPEPGLSEAQTLRDNTRDKHFGLEDRQLQLAEPLSGSVLASERADTRTQRRKGGTGNNTSARLNAAGVSPGIFVLTPQNPSFARVNSMLHEATAGIENVSAISESERQEMRDVLQQLSRVIWQRPTTAADPFFGREGTLTDAIRTLTGEPTPQQRSNIKTEIQNFINKHDSRNEQERIVAGLDTVVARAHTSRGVASGGVTFADDVIFGDGTTVPLRRPPFSAPLTRAGPFVQAGAHLRAVAQDHTARASAAVVGISSAFGETIRETFARSVTAGRHTRAKVRVALRRAGVQGASVLSKAASLKTALRSRLAKLQTAIRHAPTDAERARLRRAIAEVRQRLGNPSREGVLKGARAGAIGALALGATAAAAAAVGAGASTLLNQLRDNESDDEDKKKERNRKKAFKDRWLGFRHNANLTSAQAFRRLSPGERRLAQRFASEIVPNRSVRTRRFVTSISQPGHTGPDFEVSSAAFARRRALRVQQQQRQR